MTRSTKEHGIVASADYLRGDSRCQEYTYRHTAEIRIRKPGGTPGFLEVVGESV
jgi:hypothetical protein